MSCFYSCTQAHGTPFKLFKLHISGNCMQTHGTIQKLIEQHQAYRIACKLMEQHQAYGTACKLISSWNCSKLIELHSSSWNCIQAHGTACKLMKLHASFRNCMQASKWGPTNPLLNTSNWCIHFYQKKALRSSCELLRQNDSEWFKLKLYEWRQNEVYVTNNKASSSPACSC